MSLIGAIRRYFRRIKEADRAEQLNKEMQERLQREQDRAAMREERILLAHLRHHQICPICGYERLEDC